MLPVFLQLVGMKHESEVLSVSPQALSVLKQKLSELIATLRYIHF